MYFRVTLTSDPFEEGGSSPEAQISVPASSLLVGGASIGAPSNRCYIGIFGHNNPTLENTWVLGGKAIQNYYTVFTQDFGNDNRMVLAVGIAPANP